MPLLKRKTRRDNDFIDIIKAVHFWTAFFYSYLCKMETQRQKKIARLLQKDLGEILSEYARNKYGNVLITVTKVHPTQDLSIAKIYLSLFAVADKKQLLKDIQNSSKEFRLLLGNRVRHQLRVVPELSFYEDDSLDYIEKIDNLLQQ